MDCGIIRQQRDRHAVFEVRWSALRSADRWTIAKTVPAMGGVFELYWMDERKKLRLLRIADGRYGGMRSEIRRFIDPELEEDQRIRGILENYKLYFRYALTDSAQDMADVVWFFRKTYFPEDPGVQHSGRFDRIALKESAPDKVRWVE